MNEFVRELAVKAGFDVEAQKKEIAVFVDLIMGEVWDLVVECDDNPKMIMHEPFLTIVNKITERFDSY